MARVRLRRAGQTSPEGLLPPKDGEIAPRPASPVLPLLLRGKPNLFFKSPTTTQRASRLAGSPLSATGKPGEVGGEGLCGVE